ncbi:MAG: hypothetical protein D6736_06310 [Nitrospinota bacterium]|nr:MAG: hypothetical protein D6736_06310 [Nitrospinota bacterium]
MSRKGRTGGILLLLFLLSLSLTGCDVNLCFWGCTKGAEPTAEAQEPLSQQPDNLFTPRGTFTAQYSNSDIGGGENAIVQRAIGIRITRNQRNLGDLSLSFSFFPIDPTDLSPDQEVGRAELTILIPEEDIVEDQDIDIVRTQPSNFEPSATYTEEGDNPFTASSVTGSINFRFVNGNQISGSFELTFTSGNRSRSFRSGSFSAFIDLNPAEEGFQFSEGRQ